MARRAKSVPDTDTEDYAIGVPTLTKRGRRKLLSLLGAMVLGADDEPRSLLSHLRIVRDRLVGFLEMIDRCDVLYLDTDGQRIVFVVSAAREEHLDLIRGAIVQERSMLDELGIDPREIALDGRLIRVPVRAPEAGPTLH